MSMENQEGGPVKSPCIGVCQVGTAGWCTGCYRTLQEIAVWGSAPPQDQRVILANVQQRRCAAVDRPIDASPAAK